jgi:hypothetical protein
MILITFSYAIAAFLIDTMWVVTYAGINMITTASPEIESIDVGGGELLKSKANRQLLEIPLIYVNGVFHNPKQNFANTGLKVGTPGILHITDKVSETFNQLIQGIISDILNAQGKGQCIGTQLAPPFFHFSLRYCVVNILGGLASLLAQLIVFVVLIVALFKVWFNLMKAFIYTLLYVIVSPIMIVFGLLPSKPMGFANWMKRLFVNIAVFPLTAFVLVGARVLMDIYDRGTTDQFIPPLLGHNATSNFGAILAFGAIIMTPHLQTILQEKMGVKGVGSPGLVAAGIAGGAGVIGKPAGNAMKHLNRKDSAGQAVGALARFRKESGNKFLEKASKSSLNPFKDATKRRLGLRTALQERSPHESEGRIRSAFNNPEHAYWKEPGHEGQAPQPTWWQRKRKKNGEGNGGEGAGSTGGPSGPGGTGGSGGATAGSRPSWGQRMKNRKNGDSGKDGKTTINVNIDALKAFHKGTEEYLKKPENAGKAGKIEKAFAQKAATHPSLAGKARSTWTDVDKAAAKAILDEILSRRKL